GGGGAGPGGRELDGQEPGASAPPPRTVTQPLAPDLRIEGALASDGHTVTGELRIVDPVAGEVLDRITVDTQGRDWSDLVAELAREVANRLRNRRVTTTTTSTTSTTTAIARPTHLYTRLGLVSLMPAQLPNDPPRARRRHVHVDHPGVLLPVHGRQSPQVHVRRPVRDLRRGPVRGPRRAHGRDLPARREWC